MKRVICPECGGDIVCEDVYDTESWDNTTTVDDCYGYCSCCKRSWQWKERFVFTEAFDFEEYED